MHVYKFFIIFLLDNYLCLYELEEKLARTDTIIWTVYVILAEIMVRFGPCILLITLNFLMIRDFHTSLNRELLGSNGKTHRIWNGGLPPDRLPMSFPIRPQSFTLQRGVKTPSPHKSDQLLVFNDPIMGAGTEFVQKATNRPHNLNILLLVVAANIVGLTNCALCNYFHQSSRMILNKQPIANLSAFSINGQRLASNSVQNDERYQFLREMIRPIIIGAISNDDRKTKSSTPSPH